MSVQEPSRGHRSKSSYRFGQEETKSRRANEPPNHAINTRRSRRARRARAVLTTGIYHLQCRRVINTGDHCTDASALHATPVTSLQQVKVFGVSRDGWLRTNSLQHLMGHTQQVRRTMYCTSRSTVSPINQMSEPNNASTVLAFVASFMELAMVRYKITFYWARSVAPSGRLCVFIRISSDLAEEENNTRKLRVGVQLKFATHTEVAASVLVGTVRGR